MRTVRVLPGEPLSMDLVNTIWVEHDELVDALVDVEGVRAWIDLQGIDCPATETAREALIAARTAIREHIATPDSPSARAALNAVLNWGFSRPTVTASGVVGHSETQDPAQLAAWLAVVNYVELLSTGAGRVRRCAHEQCVLHFHDTSARARAVGARCRGAATGPRPPGTTPAPGNPEPI